MRTPLRIKAKIRTTTRIRNLSAILMPVRLFVGEVFGFTTHALLKVLRGKFRTVNWLLYLLTALLIPRFQYMGAQ